MVTTKVTDPSGTRKGPLGRSMLKELKSVLRPPSIHNPGSVSVRPSDERLTALLSNSKGWLEVEPLGRVKMIETEKDLTKTHIRMFAAFCALIGVMIIMPPFDGDVSQN